MTKENLFLLLSNIEGVGYKSVEKLLKIYNINKELSDVIKEISNLKIKNSTKERIVDNVKNSKEYIEKHRVYLKEKNIKIVNIFDIDGKYPLKEIYDPPSYLYRLGNKVGFKNCISIIGARECSGYGKRIAYSLAYSLSKLGFVIVSGMAYGIDAYAHRGALDAGGKTIAVLGSGVDVCYPSSNRKLYKDIIDNGCILSEFALGQNPSKYTFPQRNRIVSGLSSSIIVIEAKRKSGTMITVKYALDQGRRVFAVPGNIDSELSEGTNFLIKEGAIPCTGVEDIIEEIYI